VAGKISEMAAAGTLTGAELLEVVQTGSTRRSTAGAIAARRVRAMSQRRCYEWHGDVTIADEAVTNAKLAHVATSTIKGRDTAGTGDVEDLTPAEVSVLVQGSGLDVDACGFRGIPQNAQTGNYTLVAADAGKHIYHASGAGAGDTYTIPANASVAFEIGTAITFVNLAADSVAIAITSDTMYLAGTGTTGSRTLAQYGVATAIKIDTTTWIISGTGLT
jgi:hypothetical protein